MADLPDIEELNMMVSGAAQAPTTSALPDIEELDKLAAKQETASSLPELADLDTMVAGVKGKLSEQEQATLNSAFEQKNTDFVRDDELELIAKKHGMDAEKLKNISGYFGAVRFGKEFEAGEVGKGIVYQLSETVPFANLIRLAYKKAQSPEERAAIDEMNDLLDARRSKTQMAAEAVSSLAGGLAMPAGLISKQAALADKAVETGKALQQAGKFTSQASGLITTGRAGQLATKAGVPLVESAATGLANSREGEELESAFMGMATGAVLGGAIYGAGKALGAKSGVKLTPRMEKLKEEAKAHMDSLEPEEGIALMARAEEALDIKKPEIDLVEKPIVFGKTIAKVDDITPEMQVMVAKEFDIPVSDLSKFEPQVLLDKAVEIQTDLRRGFTTYLGREGQDVDTFFNNQRKQLGDQDLEIAFYNYKKSEFIKQEVIDGIIDEQSSKPTLLSTMIDAFKARGFKARQIDKKLGTDIELVKDELSDGLTRFSNLLGAEAKVIRNTAKLIKENDVDVKEVYDAIDLGKQVDPESPLGQVVGKVRDYFEQGRLKANEQFGLNIPKRDNYIPHIVLQDSRKIVLRLEMAAAELKKQGYDIDNLKPQQLAKLNSEKAGNPLFSELFRSVMTLTDRQNIKTPAQFKAAFKQAVNPEYLSSPKYSRLGIALSRDGNVPKLIREDDVEQLMKGWSAATFRHGLLKKPLEKLRYARALARAAGDEQSEAYINKYMGSLLGGSREGTLGGAVKSAMYKLSLNAAKAANKEKNPIKKAMLELVSETPEFFQITSANVYPAFLGLNIGSTVTNLMQPLVMATPELGWFSLPKTLNAYATLQNTLMEGTAIKVALPEVAQELGVKVGDTVKTRDLNIILKNRGLKATQWNTDLVDTMHQQLNKNPIVKAYGTVSDKWAKVAMGMYESAETVNRFIASEMATNVSESLVKELNSGKPGMASKYLEKMGPSYQKALKAAIKKDDLLEANKLITNHILANSIYNYNKANVSEFADFVGPLFAAFTRFPIEITSSIIEKWQANGLLKGSFENARIYLAPLALFTMIDNTVLEDREDNPALRTIFRKSGTSAWAPVGSINSVLKGDVLQAPVMQTATGLAGAVQGLTQGETALLEKWVTESAQTYVPVFSTLYRILDKDLGIIED